MNGLSGSSGPSHVRRTVDLRRTEAPGLGEMPSGHRKRQQRRRYAVVMLDSDGRLTDQRLFFGTAVAIAYAGHLQLSQMNMEALRKLG